jgi:hypothetical protein
VLRNVNPSKSGSEAISAASSRLLVNCSRTAFHAPDSTVGQPIAADVTRRSAFPCRRLINRVCQKAVLRDDFGDGVGRSGEPAHCVLLGHIGKYLCWWHVRVCVDEQVSKIHSYTLQERGASGCVWPLFPVQCTSEVSSGVLTHSGTGCGPGSIA